MGAARRVPSSFRGGVGFPCPSLALVGTVMATQGVEMFPAGEADRIITYASSRRCTLRMISAPLPLVFPHLLSLSFPLPSGFFLLIGLGL